MVQRYTFLHKTSENENIFVLNFLKSNNMKGNCKKNGGYPRRVTAKFVSSIPYGYAKYRRRKG